MADVCTGCGKKIGMFGSTTGCDADGCEAKFCKDCYENTDKISDCAKCDGTFCAKHLPTTQHECTPVDEIETDDSGEDLEVWESTDKNFAIISWSNYNGDEINTKLSNKIGEYLAKGFKLLDHSKADDSEVWMSK